MKRILTLSLILILLGAQIALAQKSQGAYDLLLAVGKTTLPENTHTFKTDQQLSNSEKQAPYYYRYVQFYDMPTLSEQKAIKATGLQLLEYIPHKTYVAAFPKGFDTNKLTNLNIRSVSKIDGTHKIHHLLTTGDLPTWAVVGNEIDVMVMYHKGFPKTIMINTFSSKGYNILKISDANDLMVVRIPQNDILTVANLHFVRHIGAINPPAEKEDILGGSLQRSTSIRSKLPGGRNYTGEGVNILCRDDGLVGPHIDFQGNMTNLTTDATGTHGDGVSGILSGAGNLDPTNIGMAPNAFLYVIDYQSDFLDNTLSLHQNNGVMITNSSYSDGCNGGYTTTTVTVDNQIWNNQSLIHWFSAGNSNNSSCGYGAGIEWGNITGGHKIGKNAVATANLNADEVLQNTSSRGPASDGRIKPDLAAHGAGHVSTDPNNAYQSFGGTSAASPAAAGAAAQLYQAYRELNGGTNPKSGLIKATMMNTAEDLGNDGPDYLYGYGRVNALRAAQLLEDYRYLEDSVSQGTNNIHTITVPAGVSELRIMTYWMEPAGSPSASYALVNDLDMEVTEPGGTLHQPLVLDPTPNAVTLANPAVEKRDSLNNVEQVVITNPTTGTYTVVVEGNIIPSGTPKYWVLYEFIMDEIVLAYPMGGEGFVPNTTERIHWDAPKANSGDFTLEYSLDNGNAWSSIGTAGTDNRYFDWTVPSVVSDQVMVRVTRGSNTGQSLPLTIIERPNNIQFQVVCADKITLSWDPVPNATAYEVYVLGAKYMDSVGTTTNNTITIPGTYNLAGEQWVSVAAITGSGVGLRTISTQYAGGSLNCPAISDDIIVGIQGLNDIQANCVDTVFKNISIKLINGGFNDQSNIQVSYQVNGGTIVNETYPSTLTSAEIGVHTFSQQEIFLTGNVYNVVVWATATNDLISSNDTASNILDIQNYRYDFESFNTCSTASDCELTICPLSSGWTNVSNGAGDDIDWRANVGGTPSVNTGPDFDHTLGTALGVYLYLEASTCSQQEAILLSPCIKIPTGSLAEGSLWYQMNGASMGTLSIDVYDGVQWIANIIPPIQGDQGITWQKLTFDLTPYAGNEINVRIKGLTGTGYTSDLAIDDFQVNITSTAPTSDFTASDLLTCPNQPVTLQDLSTNIPMTWNWTITPNTFQFINGTSATDQNPQVEFSALGMYDVKLVTSNSIGSDSLTQTNYINVSNVGITIPLFEDFQGTGFPPINWRITNSDNGITWTESSITGAAGNNTKAAFINNYDYNAPGVEDHIASVSIDLGNAIAPELSFDVAYARYNATLHDSLRIDISTDCGVTFTKGVYLKGSSDLATVADQTGLFSPNSATDWRNEVVDLTAFAGNGVIIRFVNINGYGNSLYIDNINLLDLLAMPTAAFTNTTACVGGTTFSDNSTSATSHTWDFGAGATPQTANTAGPHTVTYSSTGMKTIQLIADNANGSDTITQTITANDLPTAGFTFVDGLDGVVDFTSTSVNATSYNWIFGDGITGTGATTSHDYDSANVQMVILEAINECGSDFDTMMIAPTNTIGIENSLQVNVFPNPNDGQFTVSVNGINEALNLSIFDLQGRVLQTKNFGKIGSSFQTNVNLGNVASGIYILRLQTKDNVRNVRIVRY